MATMINEELLNLQMNSYRQHSKLSKIELQDVNFNYSKSNENKIINDISITFRSDKITVITGPSGCGKSTLLYLAAGIYPQHSYEHKTGKVFISGEDISLLPPEKRSALIGMMFQNPSLQFCMDTVENEILFCLGNIKTPREQMKERSRFALEFCGITHLKDRLLHSLSGGEKQKAMLASLVALRPKWLLLDEPFANVDEQSARELIEKIQELHQNGVGVLVVDHRLDYWLPIADEIRWMDKSKGMNKQGFHPNSLSERQIAEVGILPPSRHYNKPKLKPDYHSDESSLVLKDVTIHREKKLILKKVNYKFKKNTIYAIIGSSGSGKSTLFDAIHGIHKYVGQILLDNHEIRKKTRKKVGVVGYALQNPLDQFVTNTVLEELLVGLKHRVSKDRINKEAERILKGISLWEYRDFSPYMLSQGQQRRLGIASLLSYDCEVLICDEPTYAQDWKNTEMIMGLLVNKVRERNMCLIFSTHDHKLAQDYADVILTINEGKLNEYAESGL